jgi:hypothetical protein
MDLATLGKMAGAPVPGSGTEPDSDEGMEGLIPVPLSSLAQPDETEKMQAPGVGDAITMEVEAKVVRVDGETAYIQPTAINGNELGQQEEPATDTAPSMDEQANGLQNELQKNGGFPS